MNKHNKTAKFIWYLYIVLLFLIVIIKFRGSFSELINRCNSDIIAGYNIIPFSTLKIQLKHFSEGWARFNLFGNIIPFMPFGTLLPIAYQKCNSFIKIFCIGFAFSFFAELFQLFTKLGIFDVDDIILNVFGICLGYFIICIYKSRKKEDIF